MSCRRRTARVLATVATAFAGCLLWAAPAQASDFVWPTPPQPQVPEICLPGPVDLPCFSPLDDFVWPAPRG